MSRPFYSDAKRAKNVSFLLLLFLLLCHTFLFPRDFSGTIADTNKINTPTEPFWPTDVPFVGHSIESKDLGGAFGRKIDS